MDNLELVWTLPLTRNHPALCSILTLGQAGSEPYPSGRPERVSHEAVAQNPQSSAALAWETPVDTGL